MRRTLFDKLYHHLEKKEHTILIGARQTGKSTLLKQLQEQLKEEGKITEFLNLENREILADLNKNPKNLFHYLPNTEKRIFVFIDEIQYLDDPSNFLKLLYDEYAQKLKLIVSGSSAFYIDQKFTDSLAGRKRIFHLPTCSFEEYLLLSNQDSLAAEFNRLIENPSARTSQRALLEQEWETYIIYGGYPAVACEKELDEKILILRELRDSFIRRDIHESNVQNEAAFYNLFRLLAGQSGNLLNISELANTLKINKETVTNYLNILQKCFHISLIKPFSRNLRKELTKMPKVYLKDTGMRNCLLNYFPDRLDMQDNGALFENYVFHVLAEKYTEDEIYFWRTQEQKEVDFVLPEAKQPFALEVKYNQAAIKETKYKVFSEAYLEIPLKFIYKTPFDEAILRELYCLKSL